MTSTTADLPVVVIGAGPTGLAAAAHLTDRGLPFVVLEAGDDVGAAVSQWGHIRTFTPWRYIADPTAEKLLAVTGWTRKAVTLNDGESDKFVAASGVGPPKATHTNRSRPKHDSAKPAMVMS